MRILDGAFGLPPERKLQQAAQAEKVFGRPLVEACLLRAQAHRARGDPSREEEEVRRALALDSRRDEAHVARLLLEAEKWAAAALPVPRLDATSLAGSAKIPTVSPENLRLDPLHGRAARVGRLLALITADAVAEAVAEALGPASREALEDRMALALGVHAMRQGRFEDARPWLNLAAAASHPLCLRALTMAQILAGRFPEARRTCDRWIAAAPREAEAVAWKAVTLRAGGEFGKAADVLDSIAATDPRYRLLRGWAAYAAGRLDAALEDATALLKFDSSARLLRAMIRRGRGDPKGALEDCEDVCRLNQGDYDALSLRAELRAAAGDSEGAIASWREAIRADPDRIPARMALADHLRGSGRLEEALAEYLELPEAPDAQRHGVMTLLEQGRHAEALRLAELAVERFPQSAGVRVALARALHVRYDHYGEHAALAQAQMLAPQDPEIHRLLEACRKELEQK